MDTRTGKVYASEEEARAAGARDEDLVMVDPNTGDAIPMSRIQDRRRQIEQAVEMVENGNLTGKEIRANHKNSRRAKNRVARKSRKTNRRSGK